ncbi:MAG: T9SS type A sorting domain-containing protein, partial [bacterium]
IIDVSNPQSPYEAGYYDTPGWAWGVYVSGSYAYVADGGSGLRIINVSNPQSPYEAGYYDTPAWGVYVSGSYAYVADYDAGLQVYEFYGGGIEEKESKMAFWIRPAQNPVRNRIELILSPYGDIPSNLTLYNSLGQRVKTYNLGDIRDKNRISLSVEGLGSGIYFLRPETSARTEMMKIIILE